MKDERYYFLLFNQQSHLSGLIYQMRQLVKKNDRHDSKKEVVLQWSSRYTPDDFDIAIDLLTMEYRGGWVVIELTSKEADKLLNKQVGLGDVDPFSFLNCPYNRSDM